MGKNKTEIIWLASTANGELRTLEKIEDILENIEHLGPHEREEVAEPSALLYEFGEINETQFIKVDKNKVPMAKDYLIKCPLNILREN